MSEFKVIWDEALISLFNDHAQDGSEMSYLMWADKLRFVNADAATITIAVASGFMRDQIIRKNIDKEIQNRICELVGQSYTIQFSIQDITSLEGTSFPVQNSSPVTHQSSPAPQSIPIPPSPQPAQTQPIHQQQQPVYQQQTPVTNSYPQTAVVHNHPDIPSQYRFDNYVVGEDNSFAYNAALTVAKNPGRENNPLLIYGGVGLGKTHLMCAIGNYLYQQNPKLKIIFLSAENFTNEFIQSLSSNKINQFKSKFRSADVLLIDDVHFLQNKNGVQEELFYTFEALFNNSKHMVFTCDRPLTEMKNLEDRLRSRFGRGLNVDLQLPDYETRCAIIRRKLEEKNKNLPLEVIDYIGKNITTNIRDLEACITKLVMYAELSQKEITLQLAQEKLKDIVNPLTVGNVSIDVIMKVVSNEYGLTPADLKKKNNKKQVAHVRSLAIYLARQLTEYSTTELGIEFNRDHSTIAHSIEKVENLLKSDSQLEEKLQLLTRSIRDYKNQI